MKKTKIYNNLSEKLLSSTKIKKGDIVIYKVKAINRNPVNHNEILIPAAVNVPFIDQIWDDETQEYIDIAAIKSVAASGEINYHELWFYGSQGGHLMLKGGIGSDQEIHSYLSLCNFNGSNPNRDTSKEIIFELVDEKAKSEGDRKTRNLKREALNAAADLSAEEVRTYTAALGKDDTKPVEVLRNNLEELADKNPIEFMDIIGNKQAIMKATLNRALTKGVIIFDTEQSRFTWPNGEVILVVSRTTAGDNVEELLGFCATNAKGEKVYQTIQSKSKK